MPAVAVCTVDTIDTGHPCDSVATIQGNLQSKVTIGGKPVAIKGDAIEDHEILDDDDICVPHSAYINLGSTKVSISGIAVARVGDSADAGSITTGSDKVTAGG